MKRQSAITQSTTIFNNTSASLNNLLFLPPTRYSSETTRNFLFYPRPRRVLSTPASCSPSSLLFSSPCAPLSSYRSLSSQPDQAKQVQDLDTDELLQWIQQKNSQFLQRDDDVDKFKAARISGSTFWKYGSDACVLREASNLPLLVCLDLADLASRTIEEASLRHRQSGPPEQSNPVPGLDFKYLMGTSGMKGSEQDVSTVPGTGNRENLSYTDKVPSLKRTRIGDSTLTINNKLKHFRSAGMAFADLLRKEGQAYFDRTRYISQLHNLDPCILFCRPRRFGKTLTLSMLEHFHGLQYAGEHQSLYKGLDVQKDIDEGKVIPGQYFVLKFDFSGIDPTTDLTEAREILIDFLNLSIESFYRTYTTYLGGNFAALCQNINSKQPNVSLQRCAQLVQDAISQDKQLSRIKGIYLLVDEYDGFHNKYLKPPEGPKIAWEDTAVQRTFEAFWATIKSLNAGFIRRIFITGISPLSLSGLGSAFNISRNLSHDRGLAGLCGLTNSDLGSALKRIYDNPETCQDYLSEMTKCFNGYHFCRKEIVETVHNTETCLEYLQQCMEGKSPETEDPPNSEISNRLLRIFVTSPSLVREFEKALKRDEGGNYMPFKYSEFKSQFTLGDLSAAECQASWRSLAVYFGGFTFDPKSPATHLKIPNNVAARRIALSVLERYNLRGSLKEALRNLVEDGELEQTLGSCSQTKKAAVSIFFSRFPDG